MALQTPPSPAGARAPDPPRRRRPHVQGLAPLVGLLAALTLALSACGGGSTAGPVAATSDATPATAPQAAAPSAAAPARTADATTPAPRTTAGSPPRTATERAAQPRPWHADAAATPEPAATTTSTVPAPVHATAGGDTPNPPQAAKPAGRPLDERAVLLLSRRDSPAHYFQAGTVTGTYAGTMASEVRITSRGVIVDFTATLPGGTIVGRALAVAILDSPTFPALRGTAAIFRGTGRFAALHGRGLKVTGRARPDGSRARVQLEGLVTSDGAP